MELDLYHKVLAKLYEVTEGKDSQAVNLKDLVKSQGFLGNYPDIFQFLDSQGWISETAKADYIRITHWGVKEAKKSQSNEPDALADLKKEANHLVKQTREFIITVEEFAVQTSVENFKQIEKQVEGIKSTLVRLKENVQ